jgi:hypothetical protein
MNEDAKTRQVCLSCNRVHPDDGGRCRNCDSCLYVHSKQIQDDVYPFFRCLKCGTTNFWD